MIMKWFFPASMFFENKNFYGESGGDHDQFNLLSGAIIIFCNSFAVSRNIISDLQLPIKRGRVSFEPRAHSSATLFFVVSLEYTMPPAPVSHPYFSLTHA